MLHIIALLEIADPAAFVAFETEAIAIARRHGGVLVTAFAPDGNLGTMCAPAVDEVHVWRFPDAHAFAEYRSDPALLALAGLRERGVRSTRLLVSGEPKEYTL